MVSNLIDGKLVEELCAEGRVYSAFGLYMRKLHGFKVFKVPFNPGFTCPNQDGRLSRKGCSYCPDMARQFTYDSFRRVIGKGLREQLEDQIEYYKKKGAGEKALVYVAFGTNTYMPVPKLKEIFDTALDHPDVLGLSIGTRPDCLPIEVLDLLGDYVKQGKEVWLELGQQTPHFHTVRDVNRQHGVAECFHAVAEARKRGIYSIIFLIFGLPYETWDEMVESARIVSEMGADAVKLYPLLVMHKTRLASDYRKGLYRPISQREYLRLIADFLEHLHPNVLVQRMSKDCGLDGKIVPLWDTSRVIVGPTVEKILQLRGSMQGAKYCMGLSADELVPLV